MSASCARRHPLATAPSSPPRYRLGASARWRAAAALALGLAIPDIAAAQQTGLEELKQMTLQDLLSVDVTLVSRRPEPLFETASAIQVITSEDIRRSGAETLPEVLQRLALNLEVAQPNAHDWAISARGFNGAPLANNSMSDKLLVMIDGRTVYSPLFGGVFWDVQHVLLEDVDRIEVVSGPGGTLWGANAVNGVINIVTRTSTDTQGAYAAISRGSFVQSLVSARYGGRTRGGAAYRVYAQRLDVDNLQTVTGARMNDQWDITQAGFRVDLAPSPATDVTIQGDAYAGDEGRPAEVETNGQNLLLRWKHAASPRSDVQVQVYYDRAARRLPINTFADEIQTFDVDVQHRFGLSPRHGLLWGAAFRSAYDEARSSATLVFSPATRHMHRGSLFVQDAIALVPGRAQLTIGAKIEHDVFSGWNLQPSGRLAWTPTPRQTLWGAVSRAVHTPSRFDADVLVPLRSDPDFTSEKLTAYEVGYRVRPAERVSAAVSAFYNRYTDLRSIQTAPLRFGNGQRGRARGVELVGRLEAATWWRLSAGYVFLHTDITSTAPDVLPGSDAFEAIDPSHQVKLQSMTDLPGRLQLDVTARAVDALRASPVTRTPATASYGTFDVRLARRVGAFELSVIGRNLATRHHAEFGSARIPRSVSARVAWRR